MAHILNNEDISQLQRIFLGSNMLSNNQYQDGIWCHHTKRAYEGWCVSHGILTIAAKIQPHSLEALPLPLQESMRKYLEGKPAVEPAKPEVKLPPVVEPPVQTPPPAPAPPPTVEIPVVETPAPVVETVVEDEEEESAPAAATSEVTDEKRNLNHFKNRNNGKQF